MVVAPDSDADSAAADDEPGDGDSIVADHRGDNAAAVVLVADHDYDDGDDYNQWHRAG